MAASVAGSPNGPSQGAGGVGGLLAAWLPTDTSLTSVFCNYDGNGNVMGLASGTTGAQVAKYDYTPFGEVAERDGVLASVNAYRFSTKPEDAQLAMLYYGFRYYNSSTGRWANRDPIEERGGSNLYGFVRNHASVAIDVLGMNEMWLNSGNFSSEPSGLPSPPTNPIVPITGISGVDVTEEFDEMLDRVEEVFWSEWTEEDREKSCCSLTSVSNIMAVYDEYEEFWDTDLRTGISHPDAVGKGSDAA